MSGKLTPHKWVSFYQSSIVAAKFNESIRSSSIYLSTLCVHTAPLHRLCGNSCTHMKSHCNHEECAHFHCSIYYAKILGHSLFQKHCWYWCRGMHLRENTQTLIILKFVCSQLHNAIAACSQRSIKPWENKFYCLTLSANLICRPSPDLTFCNAYSYTLWLN